MDAHGTGNTVVRGILLDPDTGRPVIEGRPKRGREVITNVDVVNDIFELADIEGAEWRSRFSKLVRSGDPLALLGGIAGIEAGANVPAATVTAVTGVTANTALWTPALYTPIPALAQAPKMYSLDAAGVVTSSAGSQTVIINPHIGTGAVGTNLTASSAQTLGSTITNAIWRLEADFTIRTSGTGTAATARGSFSFQYTVVANVGAPTTVIWRSTADATFDSTVLNALVMGVTPSATGVSIAAEQIRYASWN